MGKIGLALRKIILRTILELNQYNNNTLREILMMYLPTGYHLLTMKLMDNPRTTTNLTRKT
jgi:hypothetical protein